MVGVVGVVVVLGGLCGAFVHGGCVGCIVCWLMGCMAVVGMVGGCGVWWLDGVGWVAVRGMGCGVWGVCVEKRVLGLFFFGVPFFAFRRGTVRRLRRGRRRAPHGRAGARVCVSFRIGGGLMDAKPAEGMGGVVCDA